MAEVEKLNPDMKLSKQVEEQKVADELRLTKFEMVRVLLFHSYSHILLAAINIVFDNFRIPLKER